jgi:CDP-diacylglycerol pyrophosphatase
VQLLGHRYWAMRLDAEDLQNADPFKLLAEGIPEARRDMSPWKLVVVGATFEQTHPGFVLLAGRADPATSDYGSGEELLDHACAAANSE